MGIARRASRFEALLPMSTGDWVAGWSMGCLQPQTV